MEIYKAGRKTYIAIPKENITAETALTKANEHFKTRTNNLEVISGMVRKGILYAGKTGTFWVIRRKEKA